MSMCVFCVLDESQESSAQKDQLKEEERTGAWDLGLTSGD